MSKKFMVELFGKNSGRTYLYVVDHAQDKTEAFIEARLRHLGRLQRGEVHESVSATDYRANEV